MAALNVKTLLLMMIVPGWALAARAEDDRVPAVVYPALVERGASLGAFVPAGWRL